MGFCAGIVGLPNVGKSTLFNALTRAHAAISNFPFCTIEPNIGMVHVPDPRLEILNQWVGAEKIVPTMVEFVDIAGLVKGASKGEGLGNLFLSKIFDVDAIVHVVRCFEDPNVAHIEGSVNPLRDVTTVDTELILKDLELVEKFRSRERKLVKAGPSPEVEAELHALDAIQAHLNAGHPCRTLPNLDHWLPHLGTLHLLTAKKVMYVANIGVESLEKGNSHVRELEAYAAKEGSQVVALCGALEAEMAELPEAERPEFLKGFGIEETGLVRLIRKGYELLGLISFFTTTGKKELRAWTIKKGWTAKQAAGVIHSDFERGFIRAEVVAYKDFVECQGEHRAREKGKLRIEGKDYIVQEGDILHIRFAV